MSKAPLSLKGSCLICDMRIKLRKSIPESQLKTHDIELPIENGIDPRTGNTSPARLLRVLLTSRSAVSDVKLKETVERIQHFALLTGGEDLLIVFLLNPPKETSFTSAKKRTKNDDDNAADEHAIAAYSKLQAEMISQTEIPYIPIRPILTIDELQTTIEKHIAASKPRVTKAMPSSTPFELLRFCTVRPPLSEQTAYLISDLFANLQDLASACSAVSSALDLSSPSARFAGFQSSQAYDVDLGPSTQSTDSDAARKLKRLRDLVGGQDCQDVIDFWKSEWLFQ